MLVEAVTNNASTGASATGSLAGGSVLGKDDFLQLLVAQLKNQDPLNPDDPTEFTAQLAQFSSLEQLFNTNELLAQMAQTTQNSQDLERLSAFSLIGRRIEVPGPDFHYSEAPVEFGYTLDTSAKTVTVQILDAQGAVAAILPQAEGKAGLHSSTWDGTGLNGQQLPPGDYRLRVARTDEDATTTVSTRISSMVAGVDLSNQGIMLTTTAGDFELAEVISVMGS